MQAKITSKKLLLFVFLTTAFCLSFGLLANSQSFFKPLIKPEIKKGINPLLIAPATMNTFRPAVNVLSYATPGNQLMTGVGVAYEHLQFDNDTQKWKVIWSINALGWYAASLTNENIPNTPPLMFGGAVGILNNLILVGVATDTHQLFETIGVGINLNN